MQVIFKHEGFSYFAQIVKDVDMSCNGCAFQYYETEDNEPDPCFESDKVRNCTKEAHIIWIEKK